MSYTKFGEYLRILRIKKHEVMGDMASKLGTSLPFLSAVENGKKNVPKDWLEKISFYYDLDSNEKAELEDAIDVSRTQYKIDSSRASELQRRTALAFTRSFETLGDEQAMKILEILNFGGEE